MTPIPLAEEYRNMTRKELESKLMEMPEPEVEQHKRLNNINTFQAYKNEMCLRGTDENGKDLTIVLNAFEVLEWLDIKHIKKETIKYIKQL